MDNINKLTAIILLFAWSQSSFSQNLMISGKLISKESKQKIEGQANIFLINDSAVIAGTSSDINGNFVLHHVRPGNYEIKITSIIYDSLTIFTSNLLKDHHFGTIELCPKVHSLDDINISAPANSIVRFDRQLFFPTESNLKSSSNGVDLLDDLKIKGLEIRKDNNSIVGERGGAIVVRINGAPANQKELLSIDPKDVIRIEYHDFPSLRYGSAEGVVDLIVKRKETGGQIAWNSRNTFYKPWWGDAFLDAKFYRGASQFGIRGTYTLHSYRKGYNSGRDIYKYDDGSQIVRELNGIPSKLKEYYSTITANYSYSIPDKFLFSAQLIFDMWNESPKINQGSIIERKESGSKELSFVDDNTYKENKPTFDLYLQKHFSKKDILAINIVGSHFNTESTRHLVEKFENNNITDINSVIDGSKYSIIGDIYFEKPFSKGQLTTGITHTLGLSKNDYTSQSELFETDLTTNNSYTYLQWVGKIKKLSYGIGTGCTFFIQKQKGYKKRINTNINPSIRLSYPLTQKMQLRYMGRIQLANPGLGETNAVEIPLNTYLYWKGNSSLNPYTSYTNILSLLYNLPKIRFSMELFDRYTPKGILNNFFQEGDKIFTQQINGDIFHHLYITGGANIRLFKDRLNFNANGGLRWMQSKSDFYNHINKNWFTSLSASYRIEKVTVWSNFSTRKNNLIGESLFKGEQLFSAGSDYRNKDLTIGLGYMTLASGHAYANIKLSKYYQSNIKSYNTDFNDLIYLRLSWNFKVGKAYKSQNRIQYNSDTDNGIKRVDK